MSNKKGVIPFYKELKETRIIKEHKDEDLKKMKSEYRKQIEKGNFIRGCKL